MMTGRVPGSVVITTGFPFVPLHAGTIAAFVPAGYVKFPER
jgi:hypothetical protein